MDERRALACSMLPEPGTEVEIDVTLVLRDMPPDNDELESLGLPADCDLPGMAIAGVGLPPGTIDLGGLPPEFLRSKEGVVAFTAGRGAVGDVDGREPRLSKAALTSVGIGM